MIAISAPLSHGQTVPSSCAAPDNIVDLYQDDADRLALRNTFRNNTTWADSAKIDPVLSQTMLDALLAVYNATSLPARDTVIPLLNIHAVRPWDPVRWAPNYALKRFAVYADSALPWVRELDKGSLVTGSPKVDSIINRYNLILIGTHYYSSVDNMGIEFGTRDNMNLIPVADAFDTLPDVIYAYPNAGDGDANDIQDSITHPGYVELTYSYGWEDCPLGCSYRRYWKFRVHPNCDVEYQGSYGDTLPANIIGIREEQPEHIVVSPNPFTDHINVTGIPDGCDYHMYDAMGRKVQEGRISGNRIEVEGYLTAGSYFLVIQTGFGLVGHYHLIKVYQ